MKDLVFRGIATALVTPTTASGVDYAALEGLIDWQLEEGIQGLVVCATTGEAPTLTDVEHLKVIQTVVDRVAGRVPVIAGTGSNDTAHAVMMTRQAASLGADACLVVAPYYNKATQKGLIASFTAVAEASEKPIILYNVPGRTGTNIEPATYAALADHPNIAGIKEAGGNISKIVETAALVAGRMPIYSGNDDQIVPILSMGGQGCISVLSNILPSQTVELTNRWFAGDVQGAAELQCRYQRLISLLFCEVNPIPVKAALAALGRIQNHLRLPLTTMEPEHEALLLAEMRRLDMAV